MLRTQGVPARVATGYASGSRDEVAGVFDVQASDAHAWVEVWFLETGWQPFDPTASVPLSADAEIQSVGADLLNGASGHVGDNPVRVLLVVGLAFVGRRPFVSSGWRSLVAVAADGEHCRTASR